MTNNDIDDTPCKERLIMSQDQKLTYDPKAATMLTRFLRGVATDGLNAINAIESMHVIIMNQSKQIEALEKQIEELKCPKKKSK